MPAERFLSCQKEKLQEKDKTMHALHMTSTWRKIRTVIADMNYATALVSDPRVPVRH
jgi:hypothetical protein